MNTSRRLVSSVFLYPSFTIGPDLFAYLNLPQSLALSQLSKSVPVVPVCTMLILVLPVSLLTCRRVDSLALQVS